MEQQSSHANSTSLYQAFHCSTDLDLIVYDDDRDAFIEFEQDPGIQAAYDQYKENCPNISARKGLLKSSMKLTEKLAPTVYAIGNACKAVLGLECEIEFYVYQDNQFNACCYPPDGKRLYIMLTSSLLEKFDDDELSFVIGHEIGHVLFNHIKYFPKALLHHGEGHLSPIHAMKLFAWGRAGEITADRVGLLCCKDFNVAARAFFKLSSGVTSDSLSFNLDEYVSQFVDLNAEMAQDTIDPSDWYSSHPFSPLRIKALEIFQRSETYGSLAGISENIALTEEQMEKEISQFMSLMDPSYLTEDNETGALIQRYLILAGYLIVIADGKVEDEEINSLSNLVTEEVFNEGVTFANDVEVEVLQQEIIELSQKLHPHLSPMQKLNILRDLSVIASCDGDIDESEVSVLHNLCHFFDIYPEFIDQVLHDAESSMD